MSIPKFFKSESFDLCPSDIMNEFYNADVKKVKIIDDINDYYYTISKSSDGDYIITKYDSISGIFLDSDIVNGDILDCLLLQWLTDNDYIIFDVD